MDVDIGQLTGPLTLAVIVFILSYKLTGSGGPSRRGFKSYFACLCATYALAVALAEINGAPVEAGKRAYEWGGRDASRGATWEEKSDYARKVFYVSAVPALMGVYLGRRSARRAVAKGAGSRRDPHRMLT